VVEDRFDRHHRSAAMKNHLLRPKCRLPPCGPLYPFYIFRRAVPYNHFPTDPLHLLYDEQALIQRLQAGGRVLFVGPPLEGKSRVVYHKFPGVCSWRAYYQRIGKFPFAMLL
jgi:hypothetical protein